MDLDLDAYLARIGYDGPLAPTLEVLVGLHRAHVCSIPFENLDILLGRPIRLDLESLQRKLVHDRRGGYCFEQGTLFAAALEAVGFDPVPLAARVRFGARTTGARTHMVLAVPVDGARWLADVGFGGDGPLGPLPFDGDGPVVQGPWSFRLDREQDLFVVRALRRNAWTDLYAFDLQPQLPVDFVVANHFTSTWPGSPFVSRMTVQRTCPDERSVLRGNVLTVQRATGEERSTIGSDAELRSLLTERFGLSLPAGTRLPLEVP